FNVLCLPHFSQGQLKWLTLVVPNSVPAESRNGVQNRVFRRMNLTRRNRNQRVARHLCQRPKIAIRLTKSRCAAGQFPQQHYGVTRQQSVYFFEAEGAKNCTVTLRPIGNDRESPSKPITASRISRSLLSDGSPVEM